MPISFGRGRKAQGEDAAAAEPAAPSAPLPSREVVLNKDLLKELQSAADKHVTGVLEVTERAHGGRARLYLYEGGLYSVHLDGYRPPIIDRLRASSILDESRADYLRGVRRPGPEAVRQQWLGVDALATVHQEYLLACLGAVLSREKVKVHVRKGEVTDAFCTLPLPVEPLIESVRVRGQRLNQTWPGLTPAGTPATVVLRATGHPIPGTLVLPEFEVLRAASNGSRTVDEVAEVAGLTRAEAVHLAGVLVVAGVLTAEDSGRDHAPADRLLVPEAFGSATITPRPIVEPEPEPEPVVEPEPEPEPVVEPEPEAEAEAEAPLVPRVPAVPVPAAPDDHVRQLRREVADAEVVELREALAEAVAAEREAIVRAAAVRARLAEAQAVLAELDDQPEPSA